MYTIAVAALITGIGMPTAIWLGITILGVGSWYLWILVPLFALFTAIYTFRKGNKNLGFGIILGIVIGLILIFSQIIPPRITKI